jgi:paxillin
MVSGVQDHFACTACGCSFPEMSYFERDGKPYCDSDYAKLFCEICPACGEYVTDAATSALGKTWHPEHLKCKECGELLSSVAFEGHDGCVYCEKHYSSRFAAACGGCGKLIVGGYLEALDQKWHEECFVCTKCGTSDLSTFATHDGKPYCQVYSSLLRFRRLLLRGSWSLGPIRRIIKSCLEQPAVVAA